MSSRRLFSNIQNNLKNLGKIQEELRDRNSIITLYKVHWTGNPHTSKVRCNWAISNKSPMILCNLTANTTWSRPYHSTLLRVRLHMAWKAAQIFFVAFERCSDMKWTGCISQKNPLHTTNTETPVVIEPMVITDVLMASIYNGEKVHQGRTSSIRMSLGEKPQGTHFRYFNGSQSWWWIWEWKAWHLGNCHGISSTSRVPLKYWRVFVRFGDYIA